MNRKWKICFVFLIFCTNIDAKVTNAIKYDDKNSKIIETEPGANLTLPCHPEFQNSIQNVSDFEWVTVNDIPIYSNGRLSPFLSIFDYDESRFDVVDASLTIREVPAGNITFTCRLTRLEANFTYFIRQKVLENVYPHKSKRILFEKKGDTVVLSCVTDDDFENISTAGASYAWIMTNNRLKSIDVISLNQSILLRNNSAHFRVTDHRELIVPNFIPNCHISYICHLSTGQSVSHTTTKYDEDEGFADTTLIKKTIGVGRGKNVTLNCSTTTVVSESNFVWMLNNEEVLSIGDALVENDKTKNLEIDGDGRWLTIRNFSSPLSGIYTCLARTGQKYAYNVTEQKSIYRTIVAENGKYISLPCSISNDEDEPNFVWTRNKNEVLFIAGLPVAGSKTDKLKIADDKRSLIITDFSIPLMGVYKCSLRLGIDYTYNITIDESKFKKQTVLVEYGTRNLALSCPTTSKTENVSSEWLFEKKSRSLMTLLFVNKEKFAGLHSEFYDIDNVGSLVIKVVTDFEYGLYTCRLSTGEEAVYNVAVEWHWNNHTVWTKPGGKITLPCPMKDPKDRELNIISWTIPVPKENSTAEFRFLDGKMFPTPPYYKFPDNAEFANDQRTLMVSKITPDAEGDYICVLIRSSTVYYYSVKIKDNIFH